MAVDDAVEVTAVEDKIVEVEVEVAVAITEEAVEVTTTTTEEAVEVKTTTETETETETETDEAVEVTAVEGVESGVVTITNGVSPHGQLLEAFAALKKQKEALVALTVLQKNEKDGLVEEVDATKRSLVEAREKVERLEAVLKLKEVSAECQISEVEGKSETDLKTALETNEGYSDKIIELEGMIRESKIEKNNMMKRTATLARRDQIQKASITTLTEEIDHLAGKLQEFENRFSSLASRSTEILSPHSNHNPNHNSEGRDLSTPPRSDVHSDPPSPSQSLSSSPESVQWLQEKKAMTARVADLETSCETLKRAEDLMKNTFVQTLTKHKVQWRTQKLRLENQVADLVTEKESIEGQVAEIAALLEQGHIEKYGRAISEDPTLDEHEHEKQEAVDVVNQ